jgi:hypothetical protein
VLVREIRENDRRYGSGIGLIDGQAMRKGFVGWSCWSEIVAGPISLVREHG